jgi:hypothetical protein
MRIKEKVKPLNSKYYKGFNDFKKGKIYSNYSIDTIDYKEWQRGWNAAYFENLEMINGNEAAKRIRKVA